MPVPEQIASTCTECNGWTIHEVAIHRGDVLTRCTHCLHEIYFHGTIKEATARVRDWRLIAAAMAAEIPAVAHLQPRERIVLSAEDVARLRRPPS